MKFAHLHCHSRYSLLDGQNDIKKLVHRVKELGMDSVAVTDHGNMYGVVELMTEAKAAGVKPIVGIEAYVAPGSRLEKERGGGSGKEHSFHLTLLAQSGEGVRNLMRLSSKAFLEGFYYKPRIDKEILEQHSEGVICLSGCVASEFSDLLLYGKTKEAEELAAWYSRVFKNRFFVEIQDNGIQIQKDHMGPAVDLAKRMGIPIVATSDAHYLMKEDASTHDVLLCINTRKRIDDPNRMKFGTNEFYIRSPEEMLAAMPGHREAVEMSQAIADSVEENYPSLNFGKRCFPSFETHGETPGEMLRRLCESGLDRYKFVTKEIKERLDYELSTIESMGFSPYFLIVWDFVDFARRNGIPCSARGSACGSIVSYCLRISHVDPISQELLFERFLDPNRSEAPDIDIDICQERRHVVMDYVRRKYGEDRVCQIGTFGTLGARSAIRDVGFVLGFPTEEYDKVSKLVPYGVGITISDAITMEPKFSEAMKSPPIKRLVNMAMQVEGSTKSAGTHAAGVVIAPTPLIDIVPLQKLKNKDKDREVVSTQWDMGDIEKAGLLKMDFLGLRNLTILDNAVKIANSRGKSVDIESISLDDWPTFALLQRGATKGVFQLESSGIRDLLVKMRPDRFEDITAVVSLYRPGPLDGGMVDSYVNRKHGSEKWIDPHPLIENILKKTYGIMAYQEDVMRMMNRLANISLTKAYTTIKAISKKKTEDIEKARKEFISGCESKGLSFDLANSIYDKIVFFGGYGFNKCLYKDSLICNADTGTVHTIEEIHKNQLRFNLQTIDERHRSVLKPIVNSYHNGKMPIFKIKTRTGRELILTDTHPLKTFAEWKQVKDLIVGDRIAVARKVDHQPTTGMSDQCDSDVLWDEIVSIEPHGEGDVYDLEIEGNHNFLANGIYVHNSHAAAYALVAYRTAYMKANYPTEFFAALLTSEIGGQQQQNLAAHIEDARKFGIVVEPPNINKGGTGFVVADDHRIYFGLGSLKGVGTDVVDSMINNRRDGYRRVEDVVERNDVSMNQVEAVVLSGALDCLGRTRSSLLAEIPGAMSRKKAAGKRKGVSRLVDIEEETHDVPELPEDILLNAEKTVLGYYVSGHPLKALEKIMKPLATVDIADVSEIPDRQELRLAGMVGEIETHQIRGRGENSTLAKFAFEDLTGSITTVVWPDQYAEMNDLRAGLPCVLKGQLRRKEGQDPEFFAHELMTLDRAGDECRGIVVSGDVDAIVAMAAKCRGRTPMSVEIPIDGGRVVIQTKHKVDFAKVVRSGFGVRLLGK